MVRSHLGFGCVLAICLLGVVQVEAGDRGNHQCVCDEAGLIGAAYGACNRYCEVLNCDAPNPDGSANACNRVLDRFFDLTGELPPCEPICPCAQGWLHSEFIPEGDFSASCFVEITDNGKLFNLSIEVGANGGGNTTASFAALDIVDDQVYRYHGVGCFSDRFVGEGSELSEDSGSFNMSSDISPEPAYFDRQQRRIFRSCRSVFKRLVKKTEAECEVVDDRTE